MRGFFHEAGQLTDIDYPGAFNTVVAAINSQGVFVGTYDDFSRGFVAVPVRK